MMADTIYQLIDRCPMVFCDRRPRVLRQVEIGREEIKALPR